MSAANASLLDLLKSWLLALLPHHLLSGAVRRATRWKLPFWKNPLMRLFIWHFRVDMAEAATPDYRDYPDFNSFFTRALQPGSRPPPADNRAIASPVDGCVSAAGVISRGRLFQAKGRDYSLTTLLGGGDERAARFIDGNFATLYLSPRDYHRIHMPADGQLLETIYIPGRLYSVAPHTTRAIPGLFTRNERLVTLFDTAAGPMAVVLVGAIFVSCMETVWAGVVNPQQGKSIVTGQFGQPGTAPLELQRGAEMGRFNMGSTVILLYGHGRIEWAKSLTAGAPVRVGQTIGTMHH
ncbi:MAG: archaetidylserine decarboxylase [Gammaproteobacteria bacterium]